MSAYLTHHSYGTEGPMCGVCMCIGSADLYPTLLDVVCVTDPLKET